MASENGGDELKALAEKAFTKPFGAVLEITPDQGEPVWIDGRKTPPAIMTKAPKKTPDCRWCGARESLLRALESERATGSAFVSGRISISGDMSVMTRLQLEGTR